MRMISSILIMVFTGMVISGCDWTSSGSDSSWSSRYEGVNFSGVYRGGGGSAVAVGVSASAGGNQNVTGEKTGTVLPGVDSYSGSLDNTPIVPGSVVISTPDFSLSDSGGGLTGNGGSGTISYSSGAWTIEYDDDMVAINAGDITASYAFTAQGSGSQTVKTLNVTQTGQHLTIIASNGAEFSGKMGGLNTSTVGEGTEEAIAEFSASADFGGQKIRLVGTFRSLLVINAEDADTESGEMTQRSISATWIEEGTGISLDVNGYTGNTSVVLAP